MQRSGIHHITLRVRDVERSSRFYAAAFAVDVERLEDRSRFRIGDVTVVLRGPLPGTPQEDTFSERRIGMDHVAFVASSMSDLQQLIERLTRMGVRTNGVEVDPHGGGEVVTFRDPDNIQLEMYLSIG